MSTFTNDKEEWCKLFMETAASALGLKRAGYRVGQLMKQGDEPTHGMIVSPQILVGDVSSNGQLYEAVRSSAAFLSATGRSGEVVVIGKGLPMPGEHFVWRGTAAEFAETWEGD